ncbi:autotransporter-associated beta strand repeat-containing protein, partial [Undibacterium sp. 5I1]|uniref:autotransporter-associated beta strand repeat-containing protein n=1 Tax=Undibacterium sp. 5I1 TaxID=3048590 RepID=UPI002B23C149
MIDNAALAVNRSDSATLANAISGSGNLLQNGSGTTILTAANSYTGTTSITAGTLQVGAGGSSGSLGSGAVIDNA